MPTTQLAKMSIDPKFVELTADVFNFFFNMMYSRHTCTPSRTCTHNTQAHQTHTTQPPSPPSYIKDKRTKTTYRHPPEPNPTCIVA